MSQMRRGKQWRGNQFPLANRIPLKALRGEKREQACAEGLLGGRRPFARTWFHVAPYAKVRFANVFRA